MAEWTAIILAGARPGLDRFAAERGVAAKALIPVGGEPMLGRVARVLLQSPSIGRVVILAQDAGALMRGELAWLAEEPRVAGAEAGEGISRSIAAIGGSAAAPYPVLVTTADHALLTADMVEGFIAGVGGADAAFAMVERKVVEAAYPETRRTWIKFRDGGFTGANLFALGTAKSRTALDVWAQAERDRKKALRLLLFLGLPILIGAVTRTMTLAGAARQAGRKAGIDLRAVQLPFADAAIDVDKEADLALAEKILAARETPSRAPIREAV